MGMPRDKTRPANPQSGTHREKTRPARQNSAVLAFFRSAGRKISRFLRRHSKQGEFSRADHHTLATQRTPTVQNSPGTQRVRPQPVQNSPRTRRVRPQPVQNSPSTAKNTQISPFEASREKIIPVETETTDAGRILSRRPPLTSHAAHTPRYKTLPALPNAHAPTKSHAIPSAPEPTTTQNVGISMIEFQSWKYSSGNCMRNCRASRKTAHKAGPVVIHRPRLVCISCISANASDYQARTERS